MSMVSDKSTDIPFLIKNFTVLLLKVNIRVKAKRAYLYPNYLEISSLSDAQLPPYRQAKASVHHLVKNLQNI